MSSKGVKVSPLATSILEICAPTLETFILETHDKHPLTFSGEHSERVPSFPKLRHLALGQTKFKDTIVLEALVTDSIRILEADTEGDEASRSFYKHHGTVRSLEDFSWDSYHLSADQPLDFLQANPHIQKLAVWHSCPTALIDLKLLPMLSQSFSSLKSLSLKWDDVSISERALEFYQLPANFGAITFKRRFSSWMET